jgi:hypothetical protein
VSDVQLKAFDSGVGYLKAGFLGFPGSGKTHTAALLAVACREHFKLDSPIAMVDTEAGGAYVNPLVKELTGKSIIGVRSRALDDLMATARQCEAGAASVLIVDSVTHIWREVCDAYLAEVNAARSSQGKGTRTRLEFQDWATIKAKWNEWTSVYLNSKLHIIICGRAGYDWDFEERENADGTTRKELVKTAIKMKVESEFGFEPSLLVDMRRESDFNRATSQQEKFSHRAVVLKDRFRILDGAICDNPDGKFFLPHLQLLTPGADNAVATEPKTKMNVDANGDRGWQREKRQREVLCEEIEGLLTSTWPGRAKDEVKAKTDAIEAAFGTRSWKKVQGMSHEQLERCLMLLRNHIQEVVSHAK